MNAYELADKLDDSLKFLDAMNTQYKNGFGKYRLLPKEVANTLRKQQKLIEELQNRLQQYECHHGVEGGHACKECYQELTIKFARGK